MLGEAGIAIDYVGFPEHRGQVLGSTSDSRGGGVAACIIVPEEIFALAEIDDLDFTGGHTEQVGWL